MKPIQHEVGSTPRLWGKFTDVDGAAYDPTTIVLEVKEPDGSITTKGKGDMTSTETGSWYYPFAIDQEGLHAFRVTAQGPNYSVARTGYFTAKDSI